MKKLILLISVLLISGCSNNSKLKCVREYKDFETGTIKAVVTYNITEDNKIISSTKVETIVFADEFEASEFIAKNENVKKVNSKEVEYTVETNYEEKVEVDVIKSAMESQEFICGYEK